MLTNYQRYFARYYHRYLGNGLFVPSVSLLELDMVAPCSCLPQGRYKRCLDCPTHLFRSTRPDFQLDCSRHCPKSFGKSRFYGGRRGESGVWYREAPPNYSYPWYCVNGFGKLGDRGRGKKFFQKEVMGGFMILYPRVLYLTRQQGTSTMIRAVLSNKSVI